MMRDVAGLDDGEVLHGDVGVVGAGFAGVELARYLGRHGLRVVLLESGRVEFDRETQGLADLDSVGKSLRTAATKEGTTPYLPPVYRGETRVRQFGGTSNIWTGKWKMLDPLDLEERFWVPGSGWPISMTELEPFYREIARAYGFEDFWAFDQTISDNGLCALAGNAGLKLCFHFKQEKPIRLIEAFGQELAQATGVEVVLGANATEILLDDGLKRVQAIVFQSLDRRRFTVSARHFVLATGGLEVPRLLLASNRQLPAGIGNAHGLVGRFYMDHPKHYRGVLRPGPATIQFHPFVRPATRPEPHFRIGFSLSEEVQRSRLLPNHVLYLAPAYHYQIRYPTERLEDLNAALRAMSPGRVLSAGLALGASPQALWKVAQRCVYRDAKGPLSHYTVSMYVEQVPNPESRVYLAPELDALGMPKLVMDWRFAPLDYDSFPKILYGLTDALAEAGIGRLEFGPEPFSLDHTMDAAHHMGTTRMAVTPAEGVVDRDCRVFGTDNLFIASCSVFPTGGSAGPTFTILALARRLGAHIRESYLSERSGTLRGMVQAQAASPHPPLAKLSQPVGRGPHRPTA